MYVEQYAQQRMNELQADRENHWRRIAEHWNQDARTVRASKWAVVRLIDRIRARRHATIIAGLPDGARPSAIDSGDRQAIWPTESAAGRFAEGSKSPSEPAHGVTSDAQRELVTTR